MNIATLMKRTLFTALVSILSPYSQDIAFAMEKEKKEESTNTQLYKAIESENTNLVQYLINQGAKVNFVGGEYEPLQTAAKIGNIDIIEILAKSGADMNAEGSREETAMHKAAESGHVRAILALNFLGAKPNAADKHLATPMHNAAISGKYECIRALWSIGGEVNARDEWGLTPMIYAIQEKHLDAVMALYELGGKLLTVKDLEDNYPYVPGIRDAIKPGSEIHKYLISMEEQGISHSSVPPLEQLALKNLRERVLSGKVSKEELEGLPEDLTKQIYIPKDLR